MDEIKSILRKMPERKIFRKAESHSQKDRRDTQQNPSVPQKKKRKSESIIDEYA